jgi:hypothetical protein
MKLPTRTKVLSVVVSAVVAAASAVGVGLWFFLSHHDSVSGSARVAEAELAQLRTRFSDQQPLLDMNRRAVLAEPQVSRAVAPLRSFHTVIFDTRGGQRIVRITVPYWFGRLFAGRRGEFRWLGELTFLDDTEFDPEAIRLSLDQLDRRGPGLVAYFRHASGGQFIAWVE